MTERRRAASARDAGQAEVQAKVDAEEEKGFAGVEVDQTPNENYTVAGVLAGKPTPESEKSKKGGEDE